MALAVVTVASGGLPVVDVTATAPLRGMAVTEATKGMAVTKVASYGIPMTFVTGGTTTSDDIPAGFPNSTTTGVPASTSLTASGVMTTTAPSQVITDKDITGQVTIAHNNCTLQNSRITNGGFAVVSVQDGITGAIIQDCEMNGLSGEGTRGISGGGTFRRNNIHHCEDGIYIRGSNTLIEDNYIHTMDAEPTDPHYDGIVNDGGFGSITIRHNTVINSHVQTSCVMMDNDFGPITTVLVENNYLSGGGYNLYVDGQFSGTDLITGITVQNNLFGSGILGFYTVTAVAPAPTFTGNYSTRGYYMEGNVPPVVGTQAFAPSSAITSGSDRNNSTGFRVAATLAVAIATEFRLVFYTGSTWQMVLSAVAFGKQSSGQTATAALTPVTFGGSTAASPIMATSRYVVSDWMPKGALTFGIGDVMLIGFNLGVEGGSAASTGNSNAVSYYGSTANMTLANPAYTTIAGACYGLARIETR